MKLFKTLLGGIPCAIALYLIFTNLSNPVQGTGEVCRVKDGSVHDGDTLRVICNGVEEKIRFACIDAPELSQDYGIYSRDHLRGLINKKGDKIQVQRMDKDRYGRTVAYLTLLGDSKSIQVHQAEAGTVWGYERYKSDCPEWDQVAKAEAIARRKGVGLWKSGNAIPPWEYRRRK